MQGAGFLSGGVTFPQRGATRTRKSSNSCHSLSGSFSAVSNKIFASKYALYSISQAQQELLKILPARRSLQVQ